MLLCSVIPEPFTQSHVPVQIMLAEFEADAHAPRERELLPQLHPEERARYHAFTQVRRRQVWLAGRALLLAALARRLPHVEAGGLRTDAHGAIRYHDGSVQVSLSHSRDWLAVALSGARVGVDLEWSRRRACITQISRLFAAAETQYLRELPQAAQGMNFYTLWTLKEAMVKAAGLSVWDGLRNAEFDLGRRRFILHPPFSGADWGCLHAGINPGWHLAVAAQGLEDLAHMQCWRRDATGRWRRQPLCQPVILRRS